MNEKNFFNLKDMVIMALFAALTCVLAPLAVPIGPVPISLTNLVIYFSLYVLGWQRATITYIVYLLLGLVGLPVFSGFEGGFVNRLTPTVEQIAKIVEHPIPTVVDIENLFEKKECCQLCFYIDDEMEQKVMSFLPNLSLSRWHPLFADVNVAGISKATGLSVFADYYGIGMTEIMACGDGGNDIPMLKVAGIGVAMGNASEIVKASANFVTDTVENDGLCKALKHFGII